MHPLVLMSVSDHFTRDALRASKPAASPSPSGLLFGVQRDIGAEIFTSCDMPLLIAEGGPSLDKKFLEQQQSLSAQAAVPRGAVRHSATPTPFVAQYLWRFLATSSWAGTLPPTHLTPATLVSTDRHAAAGTRSVLIAAHGAASHSRRWRSLTSHPSCYTFAPP